MKILYITNYDLLGGANRSLLGMICSLKESYNVTPYLLVPGGGIIGSECEKIGVKVYKYHFRISYLDKDTPYMCIRKISRRVMRYLEYHCITRRIKNEGFDIIHSNSSIFDLGYFISKKLGIPHVWHVREFGTEVYNLCPALPYRIIAREYNRSKMIAISKEIQNKLLSIGCKYDNISLIYNGINVPKPYVKGYRRNGIIKFCIVGVIQDGKNQLDVVKACKRLVEEGYDGFELHIVGNGNEIYINEISKMVEQEQRMVDKIHMHGYLNDVSDILKYMDVGIMASSHEAFGRVTVEYMVNYMPVIATNAGATLELIEDQNNLFEVHDYTTLAEIMKEYIINKRDIVKEGRLVRKKGENYSVEVNAEKIYRLYSTTLCKIAKTE